MDNILFCSVSLNMIFIVIAISVFYYGKKLNNEVNEHDANLNRLLKELKKNEQKLDEIIKV